MFDAAAVGTGIQIGATNLVPSVSVVNGIFTVQLDFTETSFSGANVFVILIKDRIDLFDTVIFVGIFAAYIWRVSKLPKDDDVESTLSGLSLRKFLSPAKAANFRIRVYIRLSRFGGVVRPACCRACRSRRTSRSARRCQTTF